MALYPVMQTAVIGAVFLPRRDAWMVAGVLLIAAIAGLLLEAPGPSLWMDTLSAGIVVGLVWPRSLGRLRTSLLVGFGGGWLAWVGYMFAPGYLMWGLYQMTRVFATGLFCWANTAPRLKLI